MSDNLGNHGSINKEEKIVDCSCTKSIGNSIGQDKYVWDLFMCFSQNESLGF